MGVAKRHFRSTSLSIRTHVRTGEAMETVASLAAHYGTSQRFMLEALKRIGCRVVDGSSGVAPPLRLKFEERFGPQIRARHSESRGTPEPSIEETPLRVAYATLDYGLSPETRVRFRKLPASPDKVHALDVSNTREGDPWRRRRLDSALQPTLTTAWPVFYEHLGPRAACGVRVKATVFQEFNAKTDKACTECLAVMAEGRAIGQYGRWEPFDERPRPTLCGDIQRVLVEGHRTVLECGRRRGHEGPHEDLSAEANWTGS